MFWLGSVTCQSCKGTGSNLQALQFCLDLKCLGDFKIRALVRPDPYEFQIRQDLVSWLARSS